MSQPSRQHLTTWTIHSGADFGRAIAEIRARRHLTQAQLAEEAGLRRDYLAQLESGRTVTLLEHLLRILRRCGATVTVSYPGDDGEA
jgi:transcriptional regulator with XRE-family HTH domain